MLSTSGGALIHVHDVLSGSASWDDITPETCADVGLRNVRAQAWSLADAAYEHACHKDCPQRAQHELADQDFLDLAVGVGGRELVMSAMRWAVTAAAAARLQNKA